MLKKLFFFDFKALSRRILPLLIATLCCGVVIFGLMMAAVNMPEANSVLSVSLLMLLLFLFIATAVLTVLCEFYIIHHYYKNFFTDEGYLTFTLPATTDQLLWSKIFAGVLWSLISTVAFILVLFLGLLLPIEISVMPAGASFFSALFDSFFGEIGVLGIISLAINLVSQTVLLYAAITLGAILMPKRRALGAILFYFVGNTVTSIISSLLSVILVTALMSLGDVLTESTLSFLTTAVVSVILGVVGYFLTHHLLSRKLNLE